MKSTLNGCDMKSASSLCSPTPCPPFIKILSILLAMAMTMANGVRCHSLVIPSNIDHHPLQSANTNTGTVHSNNRHLSTVDSHGASLVKANQANRMSVLTKRSVGEESSSGYAGHSIMRFGRAPHNIMHFGKRSNDDQLTDKFTSDSDSPFANEAVKESVRYILVPLSPLSTYYDPSFMHNFQPINKKSTDNLETTRGVFMHFG